MFIFRIDLVYHCLISSPAVPDNEFAVERAGDGVPAVAREVAASHLVDVALQALPDYGLGLGDVRGGAKILRVQNLLLGFATFFCKIGQLFSHRLRFFVGFRHFATDLVLNGGGLLPTSKLADDF